MPGDGFETLEDAEEVSLEPDAYAGALHALAEVVGSTDDADVDLSAWALAPMGEIALLAARDDLGHPLFSPLGAAEGGAVGQVLGRPVHVTSHVAESSDHIVVSPVTGRARGGVSWRACGST